LAAVLTIVITAVLTIAVTAAELATAIRATELPVAIVALELAVAIIALPLTTDAGRLAREAAALQVLIEIARAIEVQRSTGATALVAKRTIAIVIAIHAIAIGVTREAAEPAALVEAIVRRAARQSDITAAA
jgi:hypothetical protein